MTDCRENFVRLFGHLELEAELNRKRAVVSLDNGEPDKARLFRALAQAQQLQADKLRLLLSAISGNDVEPARAASEYILDELRGSVLVAAGAREHALEAGALQMTKASGSHTSCLGRSDDPAEKYHVCQVCGLLVEQRLPDRCPVCRASSELFDSID